MKITSPPPTKVTTNANKMAVLGFGAFALKDQYTALSLFGCMIAMTSALVYARANMVIAEAKKVQESARDAAMPEKSRGESTDVETARLMELRDLLVKQRETQVGIPVHKDSQIKPAAR